MDSPFAWLTGRKARALARLFGGALALAASLAFSPAAATETVLTVEEELQVAQELVGNGRFLEALLVLHPRIEEGSADANGLFLYGLAAIGQAERMPEGEERDALLDNAIAVFHAMLVRNPESLRVRLELARAFFHKGEDSLARRNFESVLAGNPPSAVASNIERFLAAIKARRKWTASFSFALVPDSNINTASNEEIVYIYGLPFVLSDPSYSESGTGVFVSGQAEYEYPLGKRTRLRLGASMSRTDYPGSDYDSMNIRLRTGPRYFVDEDTEVSLLAEGEQQWSGGLVDSRSYGLRLEAARRMGNQLRLSADLGWRQRSHAEEEEQYLDGPESEINLRLDFRMTPTLRSYFKIGASNRRPEGDEERHSNTSLASIGANVDLPRGFSVGASGTWLTTEYDGLSCCPVTLDGEPRTDSKTYWRLSVLNRDLTMLGFSPELSLVRESLATNFQASSYERDRAELQFVRQF